MQTYLALALVPSQKFENIADEKRAFDQGTIFNELNLPFTQEGRGLPRAQ